MQYIYIFLVVLLFILILPYLISPSPPLVYNYSPDKVLFLCGTHGDESEPCVQLLRDSSEGRPLDVSKKSSFIIVNPSAVAVNRRSFFFQDDVNRKYFLNTDVTKGILPYISNNKLVCDFHEAWDFTPPSLGQSIYVNQSAIDKYGLEYFQKLASLINFTILLSLPELKGSLDNYCDYYDIPYILVEITGHDLVPKEKRREIVKKIVEYLEKK